MSAGRAQNQDLSRVEHYRSPRPRTLNQEFQILVSLICESIPEFRHYDVSRIAISIGRSRSGGRMGVWAYVVPLRYVGGAAHRRSSRQGRAVFYHYHSPSIAKDQPHALYLMTFLVPRFFMLSPRERIETIVHELYHLHPTLRGDLRRFPKPHIHHGPTPAQYDARVRQLTEMAIREMPALTRHPLLSGRFSDFESHKAKRYGIPKRVSSSRPPECPQPPSLDTLIRALPPVELIPESTPSSDESPAPRQLGLFGWLAKIFTVGLFVLGLLLGTMLSQRSEASPGTALRAGTLFSTPSASSQKVGEIQKGDNLDLLRSSNSKAWILIRNGSGREGWVPAKWVNGTPASSGSSGAPTTPSPVAGGTSAGASATGAAGAAKTSGLSGEEEDFFKTTNIDESSTGPATGEDDFIATNDGAPVDVKSDALRAYDKKAVKIYVVKAGRLFEKPTKFAPRFGVVEGGDEVKVLRLSTTKKWAEIKLNVTGEQGWYPAAWLKIKREARAAETGNATLQFNLGYGTNGYRLGFGGGFLYNLLSEGLSGRPRDRLEFGFDFNMWTGETFERNTIHFESKYFTGSLLARYVGANESGFSGLFAEAGMSYTRAEVSYGGAEPDVVAAAGIPEINSSIGLVLGVGGLTALTDWLFGFAGVRLNIASGLSVMTFAGLNCRF